MQERTFTSKHDGSEISYAHLPAGAPKAVLVIVHGMTEYKERYDDFMYFMAENGVACFIEDHRGHGNSVRSQDELGYFGENGADGLISDILQLTQLARAEYPGLPLFMLGHSMGALAVRTFIQQHGDMLDGLIVSGNPGWNATAPFGVKLAKRAQQKRGAHAYCHFLTFGLIGPFLLKCGRFYSKNAWVCSDREAVWRFDRDKMYGFEFQANGYEALLTLMVRANAKAAPAPNKQLPVSFFSGGKDACMAGKKGLEAAAGLLRAAGYERVTTKIYPGMFHEILNERDKHIVYDDMLKQLEEWEKVDRNEG